MTASTNSGQPGGVRTLIALHHGRKSKLSRMYLDALESTSLMAAKCNGDSLSVAVPSKVRKFDGPARLLSFLCDEFVLRRQLTLLRKILKWNLPKNLYTNGKVSLITDGGMSNFKVRNYIPGRELFNRELTLAIQTY